ncbi:MAG: hypothetical protein H6R13_88 [Proteobacteria bacterium]|nr:hypothetical protein [Pseudomonadota bacterium]
MSKLEQGQEKNIRYGDYLSAVRRQHRQISYSEVYAMERSMPKTRARLRLVDLHRLLTPYVSVRLSEQMWAVIPLALMLIAFQALALRATPDEAEVIGLGIGAVILGLMFFMEGVKLGLMPFAENIGFLMPSRSSSLAILMFGCLLGAAATVAEPAIGALQAAGASVSAEHAALLKSLLGSNVLLLVLAVACSVGAAVVLGLLRSMFGWRLKTLVAIIVPVCLAMTVYAALTPGLDKVLGLAWDCGGITTGPVTVPLVLAVGIGLAASTGRGENPLSGFGIVTLASLLPVIGVLGVAIYLDGQGMTQAILTASGEQAWFEQTPVAEMLGACRAVLPLVLLLFIMQRFVLRQRIKHVSVLTYGIVVALLGMMIFNVGLTEGLVALGNEAGNNVPWAFSKHRLSGAPPLYPRMLGLTMVLIFAFCIGFGATMAEPALNAMGLTVENLTDGAFKKRLLIRAVALGVGVGAAVGVAKILFSLNLAALLLGAYAIALALTWFSKEELVNLAWDSAGVTTGPVTVPLLLALGVGLAEAVGAVEGFGILAMCSVGPIISVMSFGLWIDWKTRSNQGAKTT